MTGDLSENGKTVAWNVYNKITTVSLGPGVDPTTLAFGYDASGNRVRKDRTYKSNLYRQWYVRDAQGNVMAIYNQTNTGALYQNAVYLYGSARAGEHTLNRASNTDRHYYRVKGNRHYELTNHLGNVLAVVTDRKIAKDTTADATYTPQFFMPDVYAVQNYYAFGQSMPKWSTTATVNDPTRYRYGMNGQEKDIEIPGAGNTYTAEFWEYDARTGRRWNLDPKPIEGISLYAAFGNNPIFFSDFWGDSIVDPNRTRAFNVFIVGKNRDKTNDMSAKRLQKTAERNPENSIFIESDNLDEATANEIIKRLGADGYIKTLVLDFHRGDYDNKMKDKESFYSALIGGYAGQPTEVLAGMCWSGGGVKIEKDRHLNITRQISRSLDNATVYGLKTEAANLPFRLFGNYGIVSPDVFGSGEISRWERKYRSTWVVTSYDPQLNTVNHIAVKAKVKLTLGGTISVKIKKEVTDAENQ